MIYNYAHIMYVMDNCKLCAFGMYKIKAEFIYLFLQ